MTETSCAISTSEEGDNLSGHVGSPSPACGMLYMIETYGAPCMYIFPLLYLEKLE